MFNSFAALAGWENDYTTYLQENKEFFDYTLEDFDVLLSQFDLEKYVIRGVNNSVIGFDIESLTTDYEEEGRSLGKAVQKQSVHALCRVVN